MTKLVSQSRKLLRNLRALASGNDLLTQLEDARKSLKGQQVQVERVCRTVIQRHYGGWELPPAKLRLHVGARDGALNFWAKGIASSEAVLRVFGTDPPGPVLDWGCGSGRTLLWLQCYEAWQRNYHGCDVDAEAIAWLRDRGVDTVDVCTDLLPLPYPDEKFVGLFGFSVLTHIPAAHYKRWFGEIRRVLKPDALAYVTTHGQWHAERASEEAQVTLRRQGSAYEVNPRPNHYKDSSIVTEEFVRATLAGLLTVESFTELGYLSQDAWLLRRPRN